MGNEATGRTDDIDIRTIGEADLEGWSRAVELGFLRPQVVDGFDVRRLQFTPGRSLGAYDGDRCVGTFRSFTTELTVPGGAVLAADAITAVTVSSTHRRRGLLTRMMAQDLAAARQRGEAVAILIAAEHGIYGRYGFGPATMLHGWQINLDRARGLRADLPAPTGGRVDFATLEEIRKVAPELHDRYRRTQPGAIGRTPVWWQVATGEVSYPATEWKEPFTALHRDADGTPTGLLSYRVDDNWDGNYPAVTLTVVDHFATDPAASLALWRHALSVDWVRRVVIENIAPDDPLPLLLTDPRAARPTDDGSDFMWLRVLDVPAAFTARTYGAAGRTVLEVTDPEGWTTGRWAVDVAPDGTGRCTRTVDAADLALDATALGRLYLGAETAPRLAAAGLLTELRPGAAAAADLVLRTPTRAWNPDSF